MEIESIVAIILGIKKANASLKLKDFNKTMDKKQTQRIIEIIAKTYHKNNFSYQQ
jgi:hypothetical protein